MSGLKMFYVLAIACVLAACSEFPTEPMNTENADATVAKMDVREPGVAGVSEFHAIVNGTTTVRFTWKATGRCDGFYLRKVGTNYIATYPPPYDIPDPNTTEKVESGFAPGSVIGMWEIVPYVDEPAPVGRVFVKGTTLHPKEAAFRTLVPGTPSDAWAETLGEGEVRYTWKRNPPFVEDGFELYDNDRQIAVDVPKGATDYVLTGLASKTIVPGGNDKNTMRLKGFITLKDGSRWYTPELTGFPWVQVQ